MTWSFAEARGLAAELERKTGGKAKLEYVAYPGMGDPSRWVMTGMPQEVYLGPQEAGTAFAAYLAGWEAARLPDLDQQAAQ